MSTRLASNDPSEAQPGAIRRLVATGQQFVASREFLALFDQGVVSATNFLTNVLVGNFCMPKNFGIFYMAISLIYFVRGIQEQLVSAPYTIYWHRRDQSKAASYTGSSLVHQVLLSIVTMFALAGLAAVLRYHPPSSELVSALGVLLMVIPFFLFREYVRKLLFAHFHFRAAVALDVVVAIVQLGLIGGLVLTGRISVVLVFGCVALACTASIVVWYSRFRIPIEFDRTAIRSDWAQNWTFGRWALLTHVIGCSIPHFMPWFIKFLQDESVTAMYAACQTVVGLANMLLTGVSNYLSPKSAHAFTSGGTRRMWKVLMQAAALFVLTLGPFCLLLAITGDTIPRTVFGEKYIGLGKPLLFLAIGLFASGLGMTAGNGLWAMERPALNMAADVACLLFSFGLGYLWIPQSGATGAAAAVMCGAIITAVIRWVIVVWLVNQVRRTESNG